MTITLASTNNDTVTVDSTVNGYSFYCKLDTKLASGGTTISLYDAGDSSNAGIPTSSTAGSTATIVLNEGSTNEETIDTWSGLTSNNITGVTRTETVDHDINSIAKVSLVYDATDNIAYVKRLNGTKVSINAFSTPGCALTFFVKNRYRPTEENPRWFELFDGGSAVTHTLGAGDSDSFVIPITDANEQLMIVSTADCTLDIKLG